MRERIPQGGTTRCTFDAYLASDHLTAATGKTIAVTLSKNGAAFGNPAAGATNATEIGNGSYYVDVPPGDKASVGPLIVRGTEGTIDPVKLHFDVVSDIEAVKTVVDAIKVKTDDLLSAADWAKLLANVEGAFTFTPPVSYPGTGALLLKNKAGNTTLLTITLTFDANRVITGRSVV